MLDITTLKKETFEIKTHIGVFHIQQPKVKTFRKLLSIVKKVNRQHIEKMDAESVDEIFDIFQNIINKNNEKRTISMKQIENMFDLEDVIYILSEFFTWIGETQKEKNS